MDQICSVNIRNQERPALTILVGMARSPSTRRLVIGVTALVLATVFRTSVASPDVVQLRNVDGGPEYYSSFPTPYRLIRTTSRLRIV